VGVQGHDDVELVEAARTGDPVAFGRLFDRWFDRTYDVAWHIVRNRDTAAEIAQDSFLAAWQQLPTLRQPASFGGWVLRIARNRSLHRLERERRSVPSDHDTVAGVVDRRADPDDDLAAGLADRERDQLVWAAAAALGERDASLLDLHLRHELSAAAIAEELDTSTNNVHQLLHRLRGRLAGAIRSWVLWRDGRAQCDGLAQALGRASITRFGPEAVRVISAHAADCEVCGEAQKAVLAPEALFAAVPVVVAPVALKAQVAAGLMQAGVPLGSALSRMAPSRPAGSSGGSSGGSGGSPGAAEAPDKPRVDTRTTSTGTPADAGAAGPVEAAAAPPRSLAALRSAASGRRLVLAGAAVMALVAAVVTGVVLSGGSSDRGGEQAGQESDITSDGDDPAGGDGSGGAGVEGPDASEISATTTPTILAGDGSAPGADPDGDDGPGGSDGSGGSTGPVPPGGSGGSGGTDGPGGSGGSDDPGAPPGGGATTTVPGGSPGTTTTTSTPPDPDADPPEILTFRAEVGTRCGGLSLGRNVTFIWVSLDAQSARLGLLGVLGQSVSPSGSDTRCVLLGDLYLLTVVGVGGQDSAQLEIAL
jgi:RNA polymerase sigma factor (sigma-70 family)